MKDSLHAQDGQVTGRRWQAGSGRNRNGERARKSPKPDLDFDNTPISNDVDKGTKILTMKATQRVSKLKIYASRKSRLLMGLGS